MHTPDATALLQVWERGLHASPAARGLLLLGCAWPELAAGTLACAPIGQRDAWLLSLREALFGHRLQCLGQCPACGERVELAFDTTDVRAPHASAGDECEPWPGLRLRVPDSQDLLALDGLADGADAELFLLQRCRVAAVDDVVQALEESQRAAASQALAQADAQAEVLLDLQCPACGAAFQQGFDIVLHLWVELDHWAQRMLARVHALASRYGWSEADILRLSPVRRQAYLELIGAPT